MGAVFAAAAACGGEITGPRDARAGEKQCSEKRKQVCFEEYLQAVNRCECQGDLDVRMSLCRGDALLAFEKCLADAGCHCAQKK